MQCTPSGSHFARLSLLTICLPMSYTVLGCERSLLTLALMLCNMVGELCKSPVHHHG